MGLKWKPEDRKKMMPFFQNIGTSTRKSTVKNKIKKKDSSGREKLDTVREK